MTTNKENTQYNDQLLIISTKIDNINYKSSVIKKITSISKIAFFMKQLIVDASKIILNGYCRPTLTETKDAETN